MQDLIKSRFDLSMSHVGEETKSDDPDSSGLSPQSKQSIVTLETEPEPDLVFGILKKSEISVRLSWLGKTAAGDGYAYLKATCTGMALSNIKAITAFKHLQYVDVSDNNLTTETLQVVAKLPFLVLIQADKNYISSAFLPRMKYLQVIIMNDNNLQSVSDVYQTELSTLEVGHNKIRHAYFQDKMKNIRCFDFRYNLLKDVTDFVGYPNLDSLYLAGNKIKSLEGLSGLANLRILHVRNNPIKKLDGFDATLTKLNYLNLRNCKVPSLKQVKKLGVLPALEALVLKGTPYMGGPGKETQEAQEEEDDTDTRIEVLAAIQRLKRLNKTQYSPEEREEANEIWKAWQEEAEKEEEEEEEEHLEEEHVKEDEGKFETGEALKEASSANNT